MSALFCHNVSNVPGNLITGNVLKGLRVFKVILNFMEIQMNTVLEGIKEAMILGVIISSPLVLFFSYIVFTFK